jgi:hypothetical protein
MINSKVDKNRCRDISISWAGVIAGLTEDWQRVKQPKCPFVRLHIGRGFPVASKVEYSVYCSNLETLAHSHCRSPTTHRDSPCLTACALTMMRKALILTVQFKRCH